MRIAAKKIEIPGLETMVRVAIYLTPSATAACIDLTIDECEEYVENVQEVLQEIKGGERYNDLWGGERYGFSALQGCSCGTCRAGRNKMIEAMLDQEYQPVPVKIEHIPNQTFSGEEYHLMEHFSPLMGKIHELVDAVNEINGELV